MYGSITRLCFFFFFVIHIIILLFLVLLLTLLTHLYYSSTIHSTLAMIWLWMYIWYIYTRHYYLLLLLLLLQFKKIATFQLVLNPPIANPNRTVEICVQYTSTESLIHLFMFVLRAQSFSILAWYRVACRLDSWGKSKDSKELV